MQVTPTIFIDEKELEESFIRAQGPGGQNVNKVSTAVELRFNAAQSPAIPAWLFERLKTVAGSRMTTDGVIIITAQSTRSQERNREDARARLSALIAKAAVRQKKRRPTRPTKGSKERRIAAKKRASTIKKLRGSAFND